MNKDFLIMGDAPIEVEKNIIKEFTHVDCDILKVGHHGSKTSTCDEFIKYLKPEVAIVSCGENSTTWTLLFSTSFINLRVSVLLYV